MITTSAILTKEECMQVRTAVHNLSNHWTQRAQPPCPFFTLGAASYMDAAETSDMYIHKAQQDNVVLWKHFDWLYERVRTAVERYVGNPAVYKEEFALPGYHIWLTQAIMTQPVASIHFDLQYMQLPWSSSDSPDVTRPLSFTLPISMPAKGSGLNWWDINYEEFLEAYKLGLVKSTSDVKHAMQYYPYTCGQLVLHSGQMLHQIAPTAEVNETDERITLQGHGLYCNGQWQLYW